MGEGIEALDSPGTATVWFGDEPVFGHAAADGAWVHPSHDCGRDEVSVPAMEERDAKWHSTVDSRSVSLVGGSERHRRTAPCDISLQSGSEEPQAGEKYKCPSEVMRSIGVQIDCTLQEIWGSFRMRLPVRFGFQLPSEGWCCHWLREVRRHHEDGEAICCAISNIYREAA